MRGMFGHASGKEEEEDSTQYQYQESLVPTAAASFDVRLEDCRQQMPDSISERIKVYHGVSIIS